MDDRTPYQTSIYPSHVELRAEDYREHRARMRPKICTKGPRCWVELGVDGYDRKGGNNNGGCVECKARL